MGDLHLDPQNPRILQISDGLPQSHILEVLWREYSVNEVAMSIAQNGFFPHEPLFAAEEDGRLVVVEGNRRLAAVRLLRDPSLQKRLGAVQLPPITSEQIAALSELPVIKCERKDVWQYIGFKHVNGPQPWTSFAKAEYIAWVKNKLDTDLETIARTIGDTHRTVSRLYRAYMSLLQAQEFGIYDRNHRVKNHFSFSHLYTGLDYPGIGEFTGIEALDSPSQHPIPLDRLENFRDLCTWLWGDKSRSKPALVKSQNPDLRQLDEALQSLEGTTALRAGFSIAEALNIHRGDVALFREALLKAKRSLQEARSMVVTGFAGEADLLSEMDQVRALTKALDSDMREISSTSVVPGSQTPQEDDH